MEGRGRRPTEAFRIFRKLRPSQARRSCELAGDLPSTAWGALQTPEQLCSNSVMCRATGVVPVKVLEKTVAAQKVEAPGLLK